jgi:hypothetical protein
LEDTTLLDFADYPEIAIDGVGDMQFIGRQAYMLLFRWKRIDGVWRPVVVAAVNAPAEMVSSPAQIAPLIGKAMAAVPQKGGDLLN